MEIKIPLIDNRISIPMGRIVYVGNCVFYLGEWRRVTECHEINNGLDDILCLDNGTTCLASEIERVLEDIVQL